MSLLTKGIRRAFRVLDYCGGFISFYISDIIHNASYPIRIEEDMTTPNAHDLGEQLVCCVSPLPHLLEPNVLGVLSEASSAHPDTVLTDDTVVASADTAGRKKAKERKRLAFRLRTS